MSPKAYLKIVAKLDKIIASAEDAKELAKKSVVFPVDDKLRPATAEDIKAGAMIFYKKSDFGPVWFIIEEVLHPNDAFKAFTADDGCRYGLDSAYVEK